MPERPQRSEGRAGANANAVFSRLALVRPIGPRRPKAGVLLPWGLLVF